MISRYTHPYLQHLLAHLFIYDTDPVNTTVHAENKRIFSWILELLSLGALALEYS